MIIIAAVLLWIIWILLSLVLTLIGFIVIPIALWRRWIKIEPSPTIAGRAITSWSSRWLYLWGNDEDGLDPEWYALANPTWSEFKRRFMWSALRNSCNNLQRVKYLNCPQLKPGQLKVREWSWGCWCRYGVYAGGKLTLFGVKHNYGYGFSPYMIHGMPDNDTRDVPYIAQHWS